MIRGRWDPKIILLLLNVYADMSSSLIIINLIN